MLGTRLFILGALAQGGPMHGHKIRGAAQQDRVELWSDIKPGSLYGALRRMADEGLVEVVRTEQDGNLPARTVYAITDNGRADLTSQIHAVLADAQLRPDPMHLVLQHADELDPAEFRTAILARRDAYATHLDFMRHLLTEAEPYLTGLEPLAFEHIFLRLEAELQWHDRLLAAVPLSEKS
ncbi:PadR family transcriptional regulator [Fodinicola feengrottensis]|uniref:PadR family transcriptional regulator n=1 Tax=Fodinicola feengrottensis TaxID=435914 RepID=A0ABN2I1Y0_9ACTN|nr:PadR family transcriptional regulator [Fodinicola feengrottensis]